jgi:Aromatic-ring hydroxylase, C-terminal
MRTQVYPGLHPSRCVRNAAARACTACSRSSPLRYRHSPAVEEGTPAPHRGPKAGDRLPDARIARDGQTTWLQEALATPTYHLLLCGSPVDWDRNQVAALQDRYADLVAIHRLAREAAPAVLHDVDGHAFARLGVERAGHLLVRPDGYVGYRGGGPDLSGLERYLARWLPGAGAESTAESNAGSRARVTKNLGSPSRPSAPSVQRRIT